jgi:sulfur-oxidizing protein SoxZ
MAARTLIHLPVAAQPGVPFLIRVILGHPMETGFRPDELGKLVPRNIVTRFECHWQQALVFSADLYPAIAANPYLGFWLKVDAPGTLVFEWWGDNGFVHRETRQLALA